MSFSAGATHKTIQGYGDGETMQGSGGEDSVEEESTDLEEKVGNENLAFTLQVNMLRASSEALWFLSWLSGDPSLSLIDMHYSLL